MNVKAFFLTLWFVICTSSVVAQGFAGLGQSVDGYALPKPDKVFTFPDDHGAHPDYRIEWWYLTAILNDDDGQNYGVQWTLFRTSLDPDGTSQVWMGNAGITTPAEHFTGERLARGGIGQAGVTTEPFAAWIDDWGMVSKAGVGDPLDTLELTATLPNASYTLDLNADGPMIFHGDNGYSVKSNSGQASHYYSQPFYQVRGTLNLPIGDVAVTGLGWLDREWSSQPLDADQLGWDWFSLHFDSGERLMGFGLRDVNGQSFSYASWITADGDVIPSNDLLITPLRWVNIADRMIPVDWRLELPSQSVDITTQALNNDSWQSTLYPYWEGPVLATGTHQGRGYLEMTGY